MYPGQYVFLTANVTQGQAQKYSWIVEGPIVKDYDDNVYNSTYLTASQNLDPPTPILQSDLEHSTINFYWQPNETDTTRTVRVIVQTSNGTCEDSKDFNVAKNSNDINLQAEDFYVEKNHPVGLTPDGRSMTKVLQQHRQWHRDFPQFNASYSNNGDLFFDFHRIYIGHFDAYRNLFGYPAIVAWDPKNPLPVGSEINHTNRDVNDTIPYKALELPSWFQNQPGADGPENRTINFTSKYSGQNQLPPGHPLANSGLRILFNEPFPPNSRYAYLNGHTFPVCEETDYPKSSRYPRAQDALGDFEPGQKLLGCALTLPYHDDRHVSIGGDMGGTASSPRDPIFWRYHKFIDSVSVQRFFPASPSHLGLTTVPSIDIDPPRIISQNPFRLYPFITELPTISEKEIGLFGMSGLQALSAQFNEPVIGVKASDFTVNGSPATRISGTGSGPYVFVGFESPVIGPVNVTLSSGNITDIGGNKFEGSSWKYVLVKPNIDNDKDGVEDTLEVNLLRTDPTELDSDGDSIPDGAESTSKCLNPSVNDVEVMDMSMNMINASGLDTDKDNKTNLQEYRSGTNPCSPSSLTSLDTIDVIGREDMVVPGQENRTKSLTGNTTTVPFALIIKRTGGIPGTNDQLQYNSFTKEAISIVNGTKASRQISVLDEAIAKRIVNDSGFFNSKSFYAPAPNSTDYYEYTVFAMLNGKLHAVYWTDVSQDVPDGTRNLPFILAYILGTGRVF